MDGSRTDQFFRRELSQKEGAERSTFLFLEMIICSEHLHMTHAEFRKLPWSEKMKWYIFMDEKSKRMEKERKEMETKQKQATMVRGAPKAGIRR